MLKNLLIYRFVVFNVLVGGLMAWLASKGYIGLVFASDPTGISLGIVALFGLTFASTLRQLHKVGQEKDEMKNPDVSDNHPQSLTKRILKRSIKLRSIKLAASTMSVLGIIGTVIGFIIAFAVADPSAAMLGGDIGQMAETVLTLVKGMSIALYTTLTGAVFGTWTSWNHAMIKDAVDILKVDRDVR